jgi:zinc protease
VLNGGFGRNIETTSGLAGLIGTYVARGVDPEEIGRYQQAVAAVTPQEAQAAAAELLDPAATIMVIVGDSGQFLAQLRRSHGNVTVIPLSELDLGSPNLR